MTFSHLRRIGMAAAMLVAGAAAGVAVVTPASAAEDSSVSVVHGIPGQPVDVYVNGKKTLSNFQPTKVAGPLSLPAGSYDVALTKPGGSVDSPIIENKSLAVPGGKNLSLVAHLTADGKPALTPFVNDTSMIKPGMARLVVRHTAAAPAVDVRADGKVAFADLTNPKQASADLPAGSVKADVVLAGTNTVAIGPQTLNLQAGTETIVYAIGSAKDKSLALVAQNLTGLGEAPGGMPAGTGGQAASGGSGWWFAGAGAGLVLLIVGMALMLSRRPHPVSRH
ncbi:DUF4397 domain-containing protein [Actinocatenispora thailandica]|uniref:DUF4397 domain-containing protein n=1 Tax=Actinocatenispora thailandica TaxID=227318 RepID=UPI0019524343|nr:DUF4397 domain-containing protein [Actinocatenispora thailandica]